jgi:hypothetical protein
LALARALEAVLRIEYLYQNPRRLIVREPGVLAQQGSQAGALLFQVRRVVSGDNLAAHSLNQQSFPDVCCRLDLLPFE